MLEERHRELIHFAGRPNMPGIHASRHLTITDTPTGPSLVYEEINTIQARIIPANEAIIRQGVS